MTEAAKKIMQDALALPEEDRSALVHALMKSLPDTTEEVERAWGEEIALRLDRQARGETKAVDWDEATRQIRAKYHFG